MCKFESAKKITKLEECWRALKIRSLAGKNGIFNVRCHPAVSPTILWIPGISWVYVGKGWVYLGFLFSSVILGIELVNNSTIGHETPRPSRRWTAHLITQTCNGTIDGKGDDSQEDCVRACADNSILLGSLALTNCVMLSTAAKLVRDGCLNVTADDVKVLKLFEVHDLASFEDVPVYSTVAQCAVASCHAEALGNCSRIWSEPDGPSSTTIIDRHFHRYFGWTGRLLRGICHDLRCRRGWTWGISMHVYSLRINLNNVGGTLN